MRRISRIDRSIDLLRRHAITNSSAYCSCHQSKPFSTTISRNAPPRSNEKVPLTEKVRQRIWGTDKPPGLEDPYGDASLLDQTKKGRTVEPEYEAVPSAAPETVAPNMTGYEPAATWDGLERVGGFGGWWRDNWDAENKFKGFLPAERVTDFEDITGALHRALVEAFALQQAGRPLSEISAAEPTADETIDVQIIPSATGATLQFGGEATLERILQSLAVVEDETVARENPTDSEAGVAADRSDVDPLKENDGPQIEFRTVEKGYPTDSEENVTADKIMNDPLEQGVDYEAAIETWGSEWYSVSLQNPELKFAVLKRVMQLTGLRVSDQALQISKTVQVLLQHLATPPKALKLLDHLANKEDVMTSPNISVYAKRVTPIDKERMVGRWKLIEAELVKRGLPVTGR